MAGLAVRRVRRLVTGGATVSTTGTATSPFGWAGGATTGLSTGILDGTGPLACSGGSLSAGCSGVLLLLGGGFVPPAAGRGVAASGVLAGGGWESTVIGGASSAGRLTPLGGAASGSKFASSLSAPDPGGTDPGGGAAGRDSGGFDPSCPGIRSVPFPDGLGGAVLEGVPGRMPASISRCRMAVCLLRCSVDRWP